MKKPKRQALNNLVSSGKIILVTVVGDPHLR
jgi:hypothetical protein